MQKNMALTKTQITYFSIAMNVFLSGAKLAVGIISGSTAILSEALHSTSDLATSFIAMFSVKESEKPPDRDHPYGHGRFENAGSLFEAILIFLSGVFIVYKAVRGIIFGVTIESVDLGLAMMVVAAVVNWFVSSFLIKKGKEMNSSVIEADGWHSRTDVYTATGVSVALILVKITGWKIIDPIAAIIVSFVIFRIAVKIGLNAFNVLVDSRLPQEDENKIREIIELHQDQYVEYHSFRTRMGGHVREVDLHMVFSDTTTLLCAHDLTKHLEEEIEKVLKNTRMLIHIEPCEKGNGTEFDCPACRRYKKCREEGYIDCGEKAAPGPDTETKTDC